MSHESHGELTADNLIKVGKLCGNSVHCEQHTVVESTVQALRCVGKYCGSKAARTSTATGRPRAMQRFTFELSDAAGNDTSFTLICLHKFQIIDWETRQWLITAWSAKEKPRGDTAILHTPRGNCGNLRLQFPSSVAPPEQTRRRSTVSNPNQS